MINWKLEGQTNYTTLTPVSILASKHQTLRESGIVARDYTEVETRGCGAFPDAWIALDEPAVCSPNVQLHSRRWMSHDVHCEPSFSKCTQDGRLPKGVIAIQHSRDRLVRIPFRAPPRGIIAPSNFPGKSYFHDQNCK